MPAPWKRLPAALRPSPRHHAIWALSLAVGASFACGEAKALIVPVTSRSQLAGFGNEFIDWGALGAAGAYISQPFATSTDAGTSVDVSMDYLSDFKRWDQQPIDPLGTPWQGNFSVGDKLLFTDVSANDPNPLSIVWSPLSSGYAAAGTQIQASYPGGFTARVTAYDATNALLGSVDVNGNSTSNPGQAIFVGIRTTSSAAPIFRVDFSIIPGSSEISSFTINRVDFNTAFDYPVDVVPAPIPLLGISAGFVYSRRLKARLKAARQH